MAEFTATTEYEWRKNYYILHDSNESVLHETFRYYLESLRNRDYALDTSIER